MHNCKLDEFYATNIDIDNSKLDVNKTIKMDERGRSEVKRLEISDDACKAAGCKAVWGIGNQLFISAGCRRPFRDETSGVDVGNEPSIHTVKWDTDMHSAVTRKLVNETCSYFVTLQQEMDTKQIAANKSSIILQSSREYRSCIKACILDLQQIIRSSSNEKLKMNYVDQLEMLEMSELLWSLCEILLLDAAPGGFVLRQLLEWWQLRFLEFDEKARNAMLAVPVESDPDYWNSVLYFVLQGRLDDARHMLSLHSKKSTQLYLNMDVLMKSMPQFHKFIGISVSEFATRWRSWNAECKRLLNERAFVVEPNLHTILRVLAGEEAVFVESRNLLGTWYCFMVSRLLYTNPTVQAADLHLHAPACIEVYDSLTNIRPWDSMILAAVELDIHQIIQRCSSEFRNWWLVAHLTDLLHHSGVLDNRSQTFGGSLREFLLLEYAMSMLSHHSLWQIGVTYLEHCPTFGRHYIATFVEHLAIDTEKKAYKVLNICEKNSLHDQARSICKVMGVKALRNNRIGSALTWGLQSKDTTFVAFVAEKYISEYRGTGSFSNLDLIDNLGSSMLLTSKLTFLGKYCEFHRLYSQSQFTEAAGLLLSLLTAKVAPKKFWSMLLQDAIPLLETGTVIFNTEQTYELLHCLEEYNTMQKLDPDSNRQVEGDDMEKDKFAILRVLLARNLARAIVNEGSIRY